MAPGADNLPPHCSSDEYSFAFTLIWLDFVQHMVDLLVSAPTPTR